MHHTITVRRGTRLLPMLATVLAVFMTLVGAPSTALAELTGTCHNTTWSFNGSTLTISAAPNSDGSMGSQDEGRGFNNELDDRIQRDEKDRGINPQLGLGNVKRIVVNEGVTAVSGDAFRDMPNLSSVQLPITLRGFGDAANGGARSVFAYSGLSSITIPPNVSYVTKAEGAYPFACAYNLKEVTFTTGMRTIPNHLFDGEVTNYLGDTLILQAVHIPNTVTTIGAYAFHKCGTVKDVYYDGTAEQWAKVNIGDYNEGITTSGTTIHYTNGLQVRLADRNRYGTMAAVATATFPKKSDWAVVATGSNFPDALAASALAGYRNCPIILTQTDGLTLQAEEQLKRMSVSKVYIMGGSSAVSETVERSIQNMGISTTRVAGSSRIFTSLFAMDQLYRDAEKEGKSDTISDTVIIATGKGFADSLSIGPWSYVSKSPIVLTKNDGTLSDDAVAAIKNNKTIKNVLIVGGTQVVSDTVKTQLGEKWYEYRRLWGNNRYETSLEIAKWATTRELGWNAPALATGTSFPDALAGTPLCGSKRSVLLLVSSPYDVTVEALGLNKAAINQIYILGGPSAVSNEIANAAVAKIS